MPPTARDIRVNQPLPRPVFDVYGHCLAGAGEMVETRRQADFLLRYGRVEYGGLDHTLGLDLEEFRDDPFEEIGHLGLMLQDLLRHACADPVGLPERLMPLVARLGSTVERDPESVLAAVHLHQALPLPAAHGLRTALLCDTVAAGMLLDRPWRRSLVCAALTANVGMFRLEDRLNRQQTTLTPEQKHNLRAHPYHSVELLRSAGVRDPRWLRAVEEHHERFDGSGYPRGLSGESICFPARLMAVADSYEAMVGNRAYRRAHSIHDAQRELYARAGTAYDPHCVAAFIKHVGIWPPGAVVRLSSREIAVVVARGEPTTHPVVAPIVDAAGHRIYRVEYIDTGDQGAPRIKGAVPSDDFRADLDPAPLWGYRSVPGWRR